VKAAVTLALAAMVRNVFGEDPTSLLPCCAHFPADWVKTHTAP
jgi:hypothetical protein